MLWPIIICHCHLNCYDVITVITHLFGILLLFAVLLPSLHCDVSWTGCVMSYTGMGMTETHRCCGNSVGMETAVTGLLRGWRQMLWYSHGDVKEIQTWRPFYYNAAIVLLSLATRESISNLLWIPRQCRIIHQLWYSGSISDTYLWNVDWHLYQHWWEEFFVSNGLGWRWTCMGTCGDGDSFLAPFSSVPV